MRVRQKIMDMWNGTTGSSIILRCCRRRRHRVSLPFPPSVLFVPRDNICLTRYASSACITTLHCHKSYITPSDDADQSDFMVQGASPKKERDREKERERQSEKERERERVSENHPEKNELDGDDREIPGVRGSCVLDNSEVQRDSTEFTEISKRHVILDLVIMDSERFYGSSKVATHEDTEFSSVINFEDVNIP